MFVGGEAPTAGQEGILRPPSHRAGPQLLVPAVGGCGGAVGEPGQMACWRPGLDGRLTGVMKKGEQGGRGGRGLGG